MLRRPDPIHPGRARSCLALACLVLLVQPRASAYFPPESDAEECTIAILSGGVTPDGRPILWKNRDTGEIDNEVAYFGNGTYRHLALINAGETGQAWIGVNERGFAILNALSYNLVDTLNYGITNGELMKRALESCADVAEFEAYLRTTNAIGRPNPANIAAIDASGVGAIFEAGNRTFVRFDVTDPKDAPEGFLARANFSLSADTTWADTYRFNRCTRLLRDGIAENRADTRYLLQRVGRDLTTAFVDPYPLPYEGAPPGNPGANGYVDAWNTINRRSTKAAGAVLSILPGEDPLLSTFYAVVGQPVVTIPLPVWVAAGPTPPELDGKVRSPLCDEAWVRTRAIYDYPYNSGYLNTYRLWDTDRLTYLAQVERIERWIFPQTEIYLEQWRQLGTAPDEMRHAEMRIAHDGYQQYVGSPSGPDRNPVIVLRSSPNPMTAATTIRYEGASIPGEGAWLDVFDPGGRHIARLGSTQALQGSFTWDGLDDHGSRVAPGVYFVRPGWAPGAAGDPVIVLR